ncbi:MAG TPA: hypothetical protein VJB87_03420 [Candidatus Nanoarchaeia archaeon]|nr:hypothetical protein [Candidatus Nanoarchaeia archaeon]
MAVILFSRPDHDDIVAYLHYYSKQLIKDAQEHGHTTLNCEKERSNRKELDSLIHKKKPLFIMFNGHGDFNCVCGHKNEVLVETTDTSNILQKTIVYCLSCESILGLGKKCVEEGTVAFIGYKGKFALGKDKRHETTPHKDNTARLFLEPSNLLVTSLIKGNTVQTAVEKCKNKMKETISKLRMSEETIDQDALPFLYYNYAILDYYGDGNATI